MPAHGRKHVPSETSCPSRPPPTWTAVQCLLEPGSCRRPRLASSTPHSTALRCTTCTVERDPCSAAHRHPQPQTIGCSLARTRGERLRCVSSLLLVHAFVRNASYRLRDGATLQPKLEK
eukprot:1229067-Rhodomonas_salina.1